MPPTSSSAETLSVMPPGSVASRPQRRDATRFSQLSMKWRYRCVMTCGLFHLVVGVILLGCGAVALVAGSIIASTYHGIWGGMFVAVSGLIGFIGATSQRKSVIYFYMVLSGLIASCIVGAMVIISYVGYSFDSVWVSRTTVTGWTYAQKLACSYNLFINNGTVAPDKLQCENESGAAGNMGVLVVSGFVFTSAIASLTFSCCAACHCCGAEHSKPKASSTQFRRVDTYTNGSRNRPAREEPRVDGPAEECIIRHKSKKATTRKGKHGSAGKNGNKMLATELQALTEEAPPRALDQQFTS